MKYILSLVFVLSLSFKVFASTGVNTKSAKADTLIIEKSLRRLILVKNFNLLGVYPIALGRVPEGQKEFEGDGKTPEGKYFISHKSTQSNYYKALKISYPNSKNLKNAKLHGLPAGDHIMIHGLPNELADVPDWIQSLHSVLDWTEGCIAITNAEMDKVYDLVQVGTPVWIFP